jgi:hypothetical protein
MVAEHYNQFESCLARQLLFSLSLSYKPAAVQLLKLARRPAGVKL